MKNIIKKFLLLIIILIIIFIFFLKLTLIYIDTNLNILKPVELVNNYFQNYISKNGEYPNLGKVKGFFLEN
jgi:hypothetical protein